MDLSSPSEPILEKSWRARMSAHREKLGPITSAYRQRKACGQLHPVYDFLFSYYPYRAGKLEQWHPALGESLVVETEAPAYFQKKHYQWQGDRFSLNPEQLSPKVIKRLQFSRRLLELTAGRPPNYGCYGLHEWAMVYRSEDIRHRERAPLRLSSSEISDFVESQTLSCSHFDAVRFFTPEAVPRNRLQPTLLTREDYEQPGCIHANMDLYKWSFKAMPWIGSDLLREAFFLALELRELDMRASPYDLSQYGYEAIEIETKAGRAEYARLQQMMAAKASRLRTQTLGGLDSIIEQVTISVPSPL